MSDNKKRSLVFTDFDSPFFRPPLTKALCVIIPGLGSALEFWQGSPGFGILFGASSLYLFWGCYVRKPGGKTDNDTPESS